MTDKAATAANDEDFHTRIDACIEEINALLPQLSQRYSVPEILSAFAEHIGGAFFALRQRKIFDDEETLRMIEMIEKAAFRPRIN